MANKPTKRCSALLAFREMQIRTMMRYCCMAKRQIVDDTNCWCGCEETGSSTHCWWELWNDTATLKNGLTISYENKQAITIWPSNCPLGHLSQRNEDLYHTKTCIWAFIAASSRNWKQRYPSVGEWLSTMYIHVVKHCSGTKRSELLIHTTIWMHLQAIIPSISR